MLQTVENTELSVTLKGVTKMKTGNFACGQKPLSPYKPLLGHKVKFLTPKLPENTLQLHG